MGLNNNPKERANTAAAASEKAQVAEHFVQFLMQHYPFLKDRIMQFMAQMTLNPEAYAQEFREFCSAFPRALEERDMGVLVRFLQHLFALTDAQVYLLTTKLSQDLNATSELYRYLDYFSQSMLLN